MASNRKCCVHSMIDRFERTQIGLSHIYATPVYFFQQVFNSILVLCIFFDWFHAILWLIPNRQIAKKCINVIMNCYSKLALAVLKAKITLLLVVSIYFGHWISHYWIHSYILTNNGKQYIAELFETMCSFSGFEYLITIQCHLKANGQAYKYS